MSEEPRGCLATILGLLGIKLGAAAKNTGELPYRQRDDFLSAAELSFYRVLVNAVAGRAMVCPKVNLADVFFVILPHENQAYRNKIDRKHVDFLLCDPATMQPRCGIELDDSSHGRRDRQDRDQFVDEVFRVAQLHLLRGSSEGGLQPGEPAGHDRTAPHRRFTRTPPLTLTSTALPMCPKCGVPMVMREAKKGSNAGSSFFGCPNYPRCKEIVAA